jgi:hypothetical protein
MCLLAAVSLYSHMTNASSVTYDGGTGYATGIQDLIVDGSTYNVDFLSDSYDSIFSASSPYFFNDAVGSDNAANAILLTLNSEPSIPEIAIGSTEVLWVPYLMLAVDQFRGRQVGHDADADPWRRYLDVTAATDFDYSGAPNSWLYATFTPSAVPIPAAVWLFGTALIGLVGFGKRKAIIAA